MVNQHTLSFEYSPRIGNLELMDLFDDVSR